MSKILENYTFKGFGFDVLLKNVIIKTVHGEEYPDINLNEVKFNTAKALINSKQRLNGYQLKFLRTFLKMSFNDVSAKIQVPASTLRLWESKSNELTGFIHAQERAFRVMAINMILENEKNQYDLKLTLTDEFITPKHPVVLSLIENLDYSFFADE